MKTNRNIRFLFFLIAGLFTLLFSNCTNEESQDIASVIVYNPSLTYGTVTDKDGNTYKTIKIGTQTWMAENLKTTKFRNGDPIPNKTVNADWAGLLIGAYCNYSIDVDYSPSYGRLYNWYAVKDIRNIAPLGWHVATDAEWAILYNYLGADTLVGGKLKETGKTHWVKPNTSATNESGFTGLPAGYRNSNGSFSSFFYGSRFWSSTENDATTAWYRELNYKSSFLSRQNTSKSSGFSVRCVMD